MRLSKRVSNINKYGISAKVFICFALFSFSFLTSCNRIQDPVYTGLGGYNNEDSGQTGQSDISLENSSSEVSNGDTLASSSISSVEAGQGQLSSKDVNDINISNYNFYIDPDLSLVKPNSASDRNSYCLITFDNVPNGNSLKIADALDEAGVKGIFFVSGNNLEEESSRNVVKELYDRGHSIGCNGRRGLNMRGLSREEQETEIKENMKQIETIIGDAPRFYRNPQGEIDETTIELCKENKLINMTWSFSYDWMEAYQDKDNLINAILNQTPLKNGMNILFHDLSWTAEAMPAIVDGIKEKKFIFVNPREIGPTNEKPRNINYFEAETRKENFTEEKASEGSINQVEAPTVSR